MIRSDQTLFYWERHSREEVGESSSEPQDANSDRLVYPVSAVLADRDVMYCIRPGEHGSTYGGCAYFLTSFTIS